LISVTLGTISITNFHESAFSGTGNLRSIYFSPNGGAGTYTRETGSGNWRKTVMVTEFLGVQ